jgi:hypothetical protein
MPSYLKASIERSYAESFLFDVERNENQYFLFIGKGTTWAVETSPSPYTDTVASEYQVMNDIIGYKKLNPENIIFAIPRYQWTSGTAYDQYDDAVELFDSDDPKQFYVVTDENHIFKCLGNNGGGLSTQKPNQVINEAFTLSDGYRWKYLSTVREVDLPYEISDYLPIDYALSSFDTETQNQYNTQVEAVNSSITRIVVNNSAGAAAGVYPNTIVKTANIPTQWVIQVADFKQTSDPSVKTITVSESVSKTRIKAPGINTANYVGYAVRVQYQSTSAYSSEINNYGIITAVNDAVGSNQDVVFTIKNDAIDFRMTPTGNGNIAGIEIVPFVNIVGDGTGAYALPQMSTSNNVSAVDVISGGKNYSSAVVEINSPKTVSTNHPILRPVLSPKGGHGSNILKELNARDVIVILQIDESDQESIVAGGNYRQFGIIKNPVLFDTSGELAGRETTNFRDVRIIPADGNVYSPSHFAPSNSNIIIGTETYAAAKVAQVKSVSSDDPPLITLKTQNTFGNFKTRLDRPDDYTITLSPSLGDLFITGETVTQTVPAGTVVGTVSYGYDLQVRGKIIERNSSNLTVRLLSNGNFVSNSGINLIGEVSGITADIAAVTPRYGEYVWVANTFSTNRMSFATENGNQTLYKVVEAGPYYYELDRTPAYRGVHVLEITSSVSSAVGGIDITSAPLTQTSFANGDIVIQGVTGSYHKYAMGKVFDWEFVNPSYGKLYVTDVKGTFKSVQTDGLTGTTLGQFIISAVLPPEIDRTSGEVLYINNIRPISRVTGQKEEFRIRLGF